MGKRYRVGPPVLLILLGALLGLIPRFGGIHLHGEIVLLLFLPAILYWESMNTSFREIRANMRVIVLISVGLVIATAVAVSWTARAMGMESHAAAVLGAVLSPTDAAAVAAWPNGYRAGPDGAARREHHQRRDRACFVRRDRRGRDRQPAIGPPPSSAALSAPTSAVSPPGCWSDWRSPCCAADSTRRWRRAR
ncbi:sodium/hydrogen exchanger family protein [Mycobacterium xenopi 4042]|uniref:Sodium/hydrogen exchanger family protein n=1 Tax=Mycobacterium xenopi 4042 TaxID=1299334 RepID=X8DAQ1_MYCXE|nr:sodium/hydrogen exchanger family protein [Mycobacterium xenopi 4042]